MDTMMALRAHVRGGPEQLIYEPAPVPSAGSGEVLIAVHAAAITFAELTWDLEWTTRDGQDRTPVIPSHEVSGIVAGLGAEVALASGDEVMGLIDFDRDGAAAEYAVMPAAALAAKPPSLSHVQAATLPLAALTAWQALVDHAALQPGEHVLVRGRRWRRTRPGWLSWPSWPAGRLRPVISQTFPLTEGRQAFESGRTARPPGKTVLVVR